MAGVVLGEDVVCYGARLYTKNDISLGFVMRMVSTFQGFTSARTSPVFGSSITGVMPLRLMARNSGFLSSCVK